MCYLDLVSSLANSDSFYVAMELTLSYGQLTKQFMISFLLIYAYSKGLNFLDPNYFCHSNVQGLFCPSSLQSMSYSHLKKS